MHISDLYSIFQHHPAVVTDSRQVVPGCLFFALKGAHFDGNRFASQALDAGAAYAVVDDPQLDGKPKHILVNDVLQTLQELARRHRRQFHIPVIGITGSNGKTTTKELVSNVLASHYRVHFTQGNFNNHIGVPLTLLSMPAGTEMAVIEMGANHQGEIDALSRIAEPTHGLITNIGKAHLEGFGGIEGVKKGKSELYRFLSSSGGTLFINTDEPFLQELAANAPLTVLYGRSPAVSRSASRFISLALVAEQPYLSLSFTDNEGKPQIAASQLIGSYNFGNIATAIAVGLYFNVPAYKIRSAIEAYVPSNMRSQILHKGGNTFILDAYNANPSSTVQALHSFARMPAQTKIAILGDMLELGEFALEEHQRIATLASSLGFTSIALVGPLYAQIRIDGASTVQLADTDALSDWFARQGFHEAHILIKGSRGMRLERLLDLIA